MAWAMSAPTLRSEEQVEMSDASTETNQRLAKGEFHRNENRKYRRCQPDVSIAVAWEAGGSRSVSRVTTVGMGGPFIHTLNPPREGATKAAIRLAYRGGPRTR
jgi:hypothetical protein